MTGTRKRLESELQSLAHGSTEENESILAHIREHSEADDDALRLEIHALRLFSVESGMDLGSDMAPPDPLVAALYGPLVHSSRSDSSPAASLGFAALRSSAEGYRAALSRNEPSVTSATGLIERVGQQFASRCKSDDHRVARAGSALFVAVARQAREVTAAHRRQGLH